MSKTILAEVEGFTPVIDSVVVGTGSVITAVVFGRIWRFCQMKDGVCNASLDKIASLIGLSRNAVQEHAKLLCDKGYLEDTTPNLKNHPHTYRDTGKAGLYMGVGAKASVIQDDVKSEIRETVIYDEATVIQDEASVILVDEKIVLKKDSNKPIDLTAQKYWQTIDEYLRSEMPRQLHKYLDGCVPLQWEGSTLTVQAQDAEWLDQHCKKLAKRFLVGIAQGGAVEFVA